jgi:hypothetical protein
MRTSDDRLPVRTKVRLTARIWWAFARAFVGLRRAPLPSVIARAGSVDASSTSPRIDPRRLGRVVYRVSHVGSRGPRCLYNAIVLYGLLRRQGDRAEIVIGLPTAPVDKDAHAWVEVDGRDVGPPPGRADHQELARYG